MNNFNLNTLNEPTWFTPPEIIEKLGPFDLDPCTTHSRPFDTAKQHYTIQENGLLQNWEGRVWLNPPYGREIYKWLNKMALHKNGIALIFARLDTEAYHSYVFPSAHSLFAIKGRINFLNKNGIRSDRANAPSILVSYTPQDTEIIRNSKIKGTLLQTIK